MNPQLHTEIRQKLDRDFAFKTRGEYLRQGKCPSCGKKEVYARADAPWVLRCGRLNKCGAEFHVKELYPEVFESWGDRFKATPENPNAAADAYMSSARGFSLERINGWYTQESYFNHDIKEGSATVRFPLGNGVWWERIIDRPHRFGKRKANFHGKYGGRAWIPPGVPEDGDEIWIVEGIFDAIALLHTGRYAVAAMSTNNDLHLYLQGLAQQCTAAGKERPTLVWAFDGDKAGQGFMAKWIKKCREQGWQAEAAVIPHDGRAKLDWNDMFQRGRLKDADFDEYRYQGALLMAESAGDKAKLMFNRHGWRSFPFDFDNRLYWFKVDVDKQAKVAENLTEDERALPKDQVEALILERSSAVAEICNCLPTPLYYLKNEVTDESWYYFRIEFPHDGPGIKSTFTAGHLAAPAEFKKRLLHIGAGAIWSGNAAQLDRLLSRWTFNIKTVQTVDFIGYTLDHQAYVFNAVAVKDGRIVEMNDEDYFDLGKLAIKSLSRSLKLDLNTDIKADTAAWFDKFYLCFGPKGVAALAYWLGSLFAEQIRHRFESFPFLEIVGEPGAGKTTMIEFLWKLLGRNGYEGFDPMKGSQVGFMRSMAQVANMPVVLIESDRDDDSDGTKGRPKQAFHWDSLKSLFNGGSLRTTGVKSSGNDTYDPQFRAALVISQNAAVQASPPIMERIVHIGMDKSRQSREGREAALELRRLAAKDVSAFLLKAITQEARVLEMIEKNQRAFEQRLEEAGVANLRIQKNYAQAMVLVHALALVAPITESIRTETVQLLAALAKEREQSLAKDHPIVEQFWEAFDYLNGTGADDDQDDLLERLNHHRDPSRIAVNLNHFVQVATEARQNVPALPDLKRLLKTSRQRKFIEITAVNSAINARFNAHTTHPEQRRPATVKCWTFAKDRKA